MLSVVHREQRDRSQIPCLFANLANKAESESESESEVCRSIVARCSRVGLINVYQSGDSRF